MFKTMIYQKGKKIMQEEKERTARLVLLNEWEAEIEGASEGVGLQ